MFSLTIAVGNQAWRLLYKNQEDAEKRFEIVKDAVVGVTQGVGFISDDFGQTFAGRPIGVLLEDLEKMKMAHVEMALHNARTQAMANKAAQSDPGLRANAMMNGPGVIQPMNNFRPS